MKDIKLTPQEHSIEDEIDTCRSVSHKKKEKILKSVENKNKTSITLRIDT